MLITNNNYAYTISYQSNNTAHWYYFKNEFIFKEDSLCTFKSIRKKIAFFSSKTINIDTLIYNCYYSIKGINLNIRVKSIDTISKFLDIEEIYNMKKILIDGSYKICNNYLIYKNKNSALKNIKVCINYNDCCIKDKHKYHELIVFVKRLISKSPEKIPCRIYYCVENEFNHY